MKKSIEGPIFKILFFAVLLLIIIKFFGFLRAKIGFLGIINSPYLWISFFISLACYLFVYLCSIYIAKKTSYFSAVFIFISILFFLFLLFMLNFISLNFSPSYIFMAAFFAQAVLVIYLFFIFKKGSEFLRFRFESIDLLIILWFLLTFAFYLNYNFNEHRVLLVDEGSFWFPQATALVHGLSSETLPKYAITTHSLGIPFICALPNIVFGTQVISSIFFMPIIVILTIVLFLYSIKNAKWLFLFFFFAIIMTLNRHNWLRELYFGSIYGDAITATFFLVAIFEVVNVFERKELELKRIIFLSFCLGLLAFTKPPISYCYFTLLPCLFFLPSLNFRKKMFLCIPFAIPFLIQKIFLFKLVGLTSGGQFFNFKNYLNFNFSNMNAMLEYLVKNYTSPLFFSILSFLFIFLTFRKHDYIFLFPILSIIIFVFWTYATVLSNSEFESSARYFSQIMLSLYYLGAIGFQRFIGILFKSQK